MLFVFNICSGGTRLDVDSPGPGWSEYRTSLPFPLPLDKGCVESLEMLVGIVGRISRSSLDEKDSSFIDMVSERRGDSRGVRDVTGVVTGESGASPLTRDVEGSLVEATKSREVSVPRRLFELSSILSVAGLQRAARFLTCSSPCRMLTPIKVPTSKLVPNQ